MGLTLKYEFTNGNKQDIHFDNDDETRVNNIHSWGFVNDFTLKQKISAISKLFKQGTIKGSWIKNELYLIDDKYGYYSNGWEWQFCEYTPVEVEIESAWSYYEAKTETQYETKHLKVLEFEDLYNLLDDGKKNEVDELIKKAMEEYYKKSYNDIYYEFAINEKKDKINFYLEYKGTFYGVRITEDNYVEVFADGLECYADRYDEFKDEVHKKIDEEVIKYLNKNIQKLENGFVYKNNYYETFEEIKEKIEEEGKENEEVNGT